MIEKKIYLEGVDPVKLFGINNSRFERIKQNFPKLKIVARGNIVKAMGDEAELENFKNKLGLLITHILKYKTLTENNIERLMVEENDNGESKTMEHNADVLVYGNGGIVVKARTANQRKLVKEMGKNDMVFAVGPAGTGKSYTAVALAVRALKKKEVK